VAKSLDDFRYGAREVEYEGKTETKDLQLFFCLSFSVIKCLQRRYLLDVMWRRFVPEGLRRSARRNPYMIRSLILVPTEYELAHLQPRLTPVIESVGAVVAICGFGPVASGITTARLLAKSVPESVILIGIAGSLNPSAKIGTAGVFSTVGCYGIGAGSGCHFKSASELGWTQWSDPESGQVFDDTIRLSEPSNETNSHDPVLLTVCAASASPEDVTDRIRRFPNAVAEDMETFSVAMACRMAGIPLTVIRGISNIAGDRNKTNWDVAAALDAAATLMIAELSS